MYTTCVCNYSTDLEHAQYTQALDQYTLAGDVWFFFISVCVYNIYYDVILVNSLYLYH